MRRDAVNRRVCRRFFFLIQYTRAILHTKRIRMVVVRSRFRRVRLRTTPVCRRGPSPLPSPFTPPLPRIVLLQKLQRLPRFVGSPMTRDLIY